MKSRIYSGKVMHARHTPVRHRWVFPFYFYAIDLNELDEIERSVRGFGYNHWRPVSLRDKDYLRGGGGFKEPLSEFVNTAEVDRIVLVTVARFMTRVFKPVSFYYGLRADGSSAWMIAEVNNTFGERHLYVLPGGTSFPLTCRHEKQFHVSPFNTMKGAYEFTFSAPEDSLSIEIKLIRDGEVVMDAALWGMGRPWTTVNLWKTVLSHPFTAALTMPRILLQAAILYYQKKLPIFKKPTPSSPNTIKEKG